MALIIINGEARTGKDTVANILMKNMKDECIIVSSIDPIKNSVKEIISISDEKIKADNYRIFLSEVKDAWVKYNDGAFNYIKYEYINYCQNGKKSNLITFIREPSEIDKLKTWIDTEKKNILKIKNIIPEYMCECISLYISTKFDEDNTEKISREPKELMDKWGNISSYKYDYYIHNDKSLYDLKKECINFLEKYNL